jgi:hypothetical protein
MKNRVSANRSKPLAAGGAVPARPAAARWMLRLASVLLIAHLAAVILPPFRFATSSPERSSPVAGLGDWLRPYIEAAFLSHGYAFFAPDPGPSFLLRCRLEFDDGRAPVVKTFPDRTQQSPRLLYHRHFMLAEQLNAIFVPEDPPSELAPYLQAQWRADRARYEARRRSFEQHLQAEYGASRVTIERVAHRQPTVEERLRGMSLTDPLLYADVPETVPPDAYGEPDRAAQLPEEVQP